MALPPAVNDALAQLGHQSATTGEGGRVDATAACVRLRITGDALGHLVARGQLHPLRDAEGTSWFEPSELDDVERSGAADRARAGEHVDVWFAPEELAHLDALACAAGIPRAVLIRRLVATATAD